MICNDNQAEHNTEGGITLDKMQARTNSKGFLKNIQEQIHKGDTLTEVFTRDIEENPFEKGFFHKLLS